MLCNIVNKVVKGDFRVVNFVLGLFNFDVVLESDIID